MYMLEWGIGHTTKGGFRLNITAIGEILIDMTQTHIDEKGIPHFSANPGGAPANVAVAASKLGVKAGGGFYDYGPGEGPEIIARRNELLRAQWELLKDKPIRG